MEVHLLFRMLLRDESGVTSIEYALMGSLVAMAILVSVSTLGLNLKELYEMVAGRVQEATGG
jgi:pilus assembly protein Flp/PilA